jgi:RNA polymerase sigma-70 factor (ECF subfamily)
MSRIGEQTRGATQASVDSPRDSTERTAVPPSPPIDHAAWVRAAVARYERPLIVYAHRLTHDLDRARDVVQETFLKLCLQDRSQIDSHLAEWLFTVCRNQALDVVRKEGRMNTNTLDDTPNPIAAPADPLANPAELLERRDQAQRALDHLETLPPAQREVIRLKFQHGFSYKEISRITGYSISYVGVLVHLGMKTLRARMAVPSG